MSVLIIRKFLSNGALLDAILIPNGIVSSYRKRRKVSNFSPLERSNHDVLLFQPDRDVSFVMAHDYVNDLWKCHVDDIYSFLNDIDWPALLKDFDIENACTKFYELFQCSLSSIPRNLVKFSGKDKPLIIICCESSGQQKMESLQIKKVDSIYSLSRNG